MATNTITAVQWNGDLDAVKNIIGNSQGSIARPLDFSINDNGNLSIETLRQLMPIKVEEGQWITYDLEVYDELKLLKNNNDEN